jgi:hypothetical protein
MISGALEGTTCIDVSGLLGDLGCDVIKTSFLGVLSAFAVQSPILLHRKA